MSVLLGEPGQRVLMLGDEAAARGALEAGVAFAAGYPGTPSTEVLEALIKASPEHGVYVEWSTNEKVALELAVGASMCGARAMATMKHVGLNVASDTFMSLGYSGVEGSLVVLVADDPGAHSSQNEQDTRMYAMHAYVPVLEPSCPHEAKEITRTAFDLSERYGTAIIVRLTTRVSHTRGEVILGPLREPRRGGAFKRDFKKWVLLPLNVRHLHPKAIKRVEDFSRNAHEIEYNTLIEGEGDLGVVACGVAYGYVAEALRELKAKPHVLKLASTYPLPVKLVERLFELAPRGVLVVEELEPVVENQLRGCADKLGYDGEIKGKDLVPRTHELDTNKVARALASFMGLKWHEPRVASPPSWLPPRPPTFCPGCGHRATFYEIKIASKKSNIKAVYPGDIGCYTLGFFPPFRLVDTSFCMGSSIGIGLGIARASHEEVVIATIGDSTFFHAGIPALIDAVYNRHPVLVVVMDNRYTAMTGHQPHPGTGLGPWGEERKTILIEDIARVIGVEYVEVIDPYNVKESVDILSAAIKWVRDNRKPALVVSRHTCALVEHRERMKRGESVTPFYVDAEKCTGCGLCIDRFACPAIVRTSDNRAQILADLCVGCGVCAQICPSSAIKRGERR